MGRVVQSLPDSLPRPADPLYIVLYLNDLVLGNCKIGTLDAAISGIRWRHVSQGLENPTQDTLVSIVLEGAKRTVDKRKGDGQKDPFSSEMARQIVLH